MPEVLDQSSIDLSGAGTWPTGMSKATAVPPPASHLEGWPMLRDLQESRLYMDDGPTGWSGYWPDFFAFIHPDLATTDSSLNGVDVVWMPIESGRVQILLEFKSASLEPLRDVVRDIRGALDLPVAQVAAMLGIKRRQFYNLLEGRAASASRERWTRVLAEFVRTVSNASGGDPAQTRTAILRPLDGVSFFDAACAQDETRLNTTTAALAELLRTGELPRRFERPALRSREAGSKTRAGDFIAEYRDHGEGDS